MARAAPPPGSPTERPRLPWKLWRGFRDATRIRGMDSPDTVWNRAIADPGPDARSGDHALHSALAFHNLVMSGGVLDAVGRLSTEELTATYDGYRWLGLDSVADLISSIQSEIGAGALDDKDRVDALEASADDAYN